MTNFEKITQSPETLAEFLLSMDYEVNRYEENVTLVTEIVCNLPYEKQGNIVADIVTWLGMEAGGEKCNS